MGKKKIEITQLEQEYSRTRSESNRFREALLEQLEELIQINSIQLGFPIQSRTKDWESISEKINSGRYNVKESIRELQDYSTQLKKGLRLGKKEGKAEF